MTTTEIVLPVDEEIAAVLVTASMQGAQDEDDAKSMVADAEEQFRQMFERDSRRTLIGMLRQARSLQVQLDEDAAYLAVIAGEIERKNAGKRRSLLFLEEQVEQLAERLLMPGSKHVDVPGAGRVQYRSYQAGVRIADADAFMAGLNADERACYIEQVPKLRGADAKKYAETVLAADGVLMPGVEHVEARTTATIDYEAVLR